MLHRFLFKQYNRVYRYDIWMRRHFSMTGHFLLVLLLASGVFGVDTKASTTYQLFVFLMAIFFLSLAGSLFNRLRFTIERRLPRYATVGEKLTYSLTVNNLTKKNYDGLALLEQLSEKAPNYSEIKKHSCFKTSRFVSFRNWRKFLVYQRGGIIQEVQLPRLTQQSLHTKISFTPLRRGTISFQGCHIAKPDLLGLFRRLIFSENPQTCLVLPKRYPVGALNLSGRRKYQPGGVTLANSVGNSTEFMSLRDYRNGDPLNSIHWKSYARHGKLIVKEFQDEYFVRRALVLDTFQENASHDQFEAAVSVAASVVLSERQNDALLDLMFAGQQAYCFTSGRGIDQMPHIQEILASVQANRDGSFMQLHLAVMNHIEQCSSVVCVLLHWNEDRQQLIRELTQSGIPVAVFLVHDGSVNSENLTDPPQHLHLVDYRRIAEDLVAV